MTDLLLSFVCVPCQNMQGVKEFGKSFEHICKGLKVVVVKS